jgi:AcrR family transcriptional regulator
VSIIDHFSMERRMGVQSLDASPPTRGARRKSQTRARLLTAARAIFARDGLEAATIAQITGAADVGFGTFYLHFATKEDLYRAVVTDGFGELAALLDTARAEATARGAPWWDVVQSSVRAYCAFAERNRELFLVMFAGGGAGLGLGRELQEQFAASLAAQLADAASDARARALPAPYPYPAQTVALATVVALTRTTLWRLTQETLEGAASLPFDEHVVTLGRYLVAALWGQTPYDAH